MKSQKNWDVLMLHASTVWDAIIAGAAISSSEAVKLATKEAYTAIKNEVVEIWGRQAFRAIVKVEANPNSSDAIEVLKDAIPSISAEDTKTMIVLLRTLDKKIAQDVDAQTKMSQAQVRFKLVIERKAVIGEIVNAQSVDIDAKAGSFESKKISMTSTKSQGNH
ncbi:MULTISPECIES: hypothetical protein [unclassified Methylobacterium]|uniref:hypothetical protein n=1 Tax=unclassified Methylobacterium TaxID=2615210 RepID=UPI0036F59024